MKILIINGSPRKKGLISQMLDIMREDAEQRGDKVQTVYTNDLNIKPCIGCMACRTKLKAAIEREQSQACLDYAEREQARPEVKCVLAEDDSQRVLKMLQEADVIIMGAPCYWGNIPGQMKLLFDRIVYGMMRDTPRLTSSSSVTTRPSSSKFGWCSLLRQFPEPLMKGKRCILLSTCTTPWPWNILFKQSRGAIRAMREICRYSGFKIVATIERGGTVMHPHLSEKDKQKCRKAIKRI